MNQPPTVDRQGRVWPEVGLVAALGILLALGWYGFSSADNRLPVFYVDWESGQDEAAGTQADLAVKTVDEVLGRLTAELPAQRSAKIVIMGTYPREIVLASLGSVEVTGIESLVGVPLLDGSMDPNSSKDALIRATDVMDLYIHGLNLVPADPLRPAIQYESTSSETASAFRFENNVVRGLEAIRLVNANQTANTARLAVVIAGNDFELTTESQAAPANALIHDMPATQVAENDLQMEILIENNVIAKRQPSRWPLIALDNTYGTATITGNQLISSIASDDLAKLISIGTGYLAPEGWLETNQIGYIEE